MAQVDSKKAKRPYKRRQRDAEGRREKDGTEAVINLGKLRERVDNLVALRIAAGQAQRAYNDAVNAVAKSSGLLARTVNVFVRSRAGDSFREDKAKAEQLALVFEELGELDGDAEPAAGPAHPETLFDKPADGKASKGAKPAHVTDPANHADPESALH